MKQTFLHAFSSPDLVNSTKHKHVLEIEHITWVAYAVWASWAIEHNCK
jgi:hypothetical protein